jgi:ubiquinone/menaquinone biosynthesis C-methylase UbiE
MWTGDLGAAPPLFVPGPGRVSRHTEGIHGFVRRDSQPAYIAPIVLGEKVLDIGCGAGTDLLLAARRVGTAGSAIGIDMTETMRDRARASAVAAGLSNVEVHSADATSLPLPDASVDVVISNGVLNLVPEKDKAFAEILRVLRPGGRLQLADIVIDADFGEDVRRNIDFVDWLNRRCSAGGGARLILERLGF